MNVERSQMHKTHFAVWLRAFASLLLVIALLNAVQGHEIFTNSVGMTFRIIPAGEFTMGSPETEPRRRTDEPQRRVTISQEFYLATTEVTQGQFQAVMKTQPWTGKTYVKSGEHYAATYISWSDAAEFCKRLSNREKRTYRLPTEAEWEYACRAGSTSAFSFGDEESKLPDYGWFGANAFNKKERFTHRTALKKPNAWGLYDMHGNNWEWCGDWYELPVAKNATNPQGPAEKTKKVIRGGSWHGSPALCRSACRFKRDPEVRTNDLGFRVLLEREAKAD